MTAAGILTLFCVKLPAGILLHLFAIPYDRAWRGIFRTCAAVAAGLLLAGAATLPFLSPRLLSAGNLLVFGALLLSVLYAVAAEIGARAAVRTSLLAAAFAAAAGALLVLSHDALARAAAGGREAPVAWASAVLPPLELLSAAVLGAALVAMLLGHSYLISPSLPIRPLVRLALLLALEVHLRLAFSLAALWAARDRFRVPEGADALAFAVDLGVFVAPRLFVGLVFPAAFSWLVWRTARMRSTQSATGILYVLVVFLIIGEMMSAGCLAVTGVPL